MVLLPICCGNLIPMPSKWSRKIHDDVIKFSSSLAICVGNSPVTGEFPTQRPVRSSFDAFFDLRLNKRLSKQSWGWWFETPSHPIWRHSNPPCENTAMCGLCTYVLESTVIMRNKGCPALHTHRQFWPNSKDCRINWYLTLFSMFAYTLVLQQTRLIDHGIAGSWSKANVLRKLARPWSELIFLGLYSLTGRALTARSREVSKPWDMGLDFSVSPKFGRLLGSRATEKSVKCQNDTIIVTPISPLRSFGRFGGKTSYRLVNRGPCTETEIFRGNKITLSETPGSVGKLLKITRLLHWINSSRPRDAYMLA